MRLDELPTGATVLIDANVLIYARRGMSAQCVRLLERCAAREITGVVTSIALAEFCHRRMMQEAQGQGLAASNPAKALAEKPALVRELTRYAKDVEDILAGEFTVLSIEASDFVQALKLQKQHGLLTNDSLHLAASQRAGIKFLATTDTDFDGVSEMSVFHPDDLA